MSCFACFLAVRSVTMNFVFGSGPVIAVNNSGITGRYVALIGFKGR